VCSDFQVLVIIPIIHHFQKSRLTMDELNQQLAALEVVNTLRRSKRMPLPAAELVLEFGKLTCQTMRRSFNNSEKIRTRRIVSFFGLKPRVMAKLWELLMEKAGPWPQGSEKKHLLWALHLAKVYSSESVLSTNVGSPDEKTYRKWAWLFLERIASLEFDVVSDGVCNLICRLVFIVVSLFFLLDSVGQQACQRPRKRLFGVRGLC
jgi:hypothetical protein